MSSTILSLIKAMRPHQWVKNLLLFAPILLAHDISDFEKYKTLGIAFILMCLVASSIYLINDILDREADREHPVKKNRPFASGLLSPGAGYLTSSILLGIAFTSAFLYLQPQFVLLLLIYAVLSLAYSLKLKSQLLIDVIALSFFYTLRLLIGAAAVSMHITPWLLAFSWFFFLSIAFVKRFVELQTFAKAEGTKLSGRSYRYEDRHIIRAAGITSAFQSVLVFLLYIATSEQVNTLYAHPMWLWMIAPIMIYWLLRIWFLAQRGEVDSDPVMFSLKDTISWIVVLLVGTLLVLGTVT